MDICNLDNILNINNTLVNEFNDEKEEKDEKDYDILENFDKLTNYEQFYCKDHDGFIAIDIIKNKDKNTFSSFFDENELVERIIHYDFKKWLKDMKQSFKNNNEIIKQFLLDFKRAEYFCNGNLIKNPTNLIDYLEYKLSKKQIRNILMFCTQTSLGLPYEIIKTGLDKSNNNLELYLAELSNNNNNRFRINFEIKDKIEFKIEKSLRVFKLINHSDVNVAIINILLDFNLKDKFVKFKFLYNPVKNV